jgi:rod shape-determining protein MreD
MFFFSLTLFGGSGFSLTLWGISPILVLSLLTVFSSHSSVTATVIVSLVCGIVTDSVSTEGYCFNTICFLILGLSANLLAEYVFNRNLKATVTLCFILTLIYYLAYWVIFSAFVLSSSESMRYLLQWCLPSALYTALLTIPFYFIFEKFRKIKELD